jgi:peroxiredoxin
MKRSAAVCLGVDLAVCLAVAVGVRLDAAHAPVAPGRPAPEFSLPGQDGRTISLADQKGKVVLVDFWASWCAPCRHSFPALNELFTDFRSRGFTVIAVNLDERRQDADAFLSTRPHELDVAFDPAGTTAKAFDLQGMPTSFLIGRDGTVRFVHMGYDDRTLAAYRREIDQLLGGPAGSERE